MSYNQPVLEAYQVFKSYDGQPLLKGVSLGISAGEIVCLLGPSGSGKSTLLRLIAGLESLDSGQILWDGQDLSGTPVHQRGFGLMFQDYALFPHRSVSENVAFGLRMQSLPQAEIKTRVAEALALVNMSGFGERRVTSLSGGEQQRIALARALAPRPRMLMLDEPLGALDRALKEQLSTELRQMLQAAHIPVLYVTHDQEEAYTIAHHLVLLHEGEIVQVGTASEVYRRPVNSWTARFLGMNNLLPGKIAATNPLLIQTELGIIQAAEMSGNTCMVDQNVILLLRPTAASSQAGELNNIRMTVKDAIFRGETYRIFLETGAGIQLQFNLNRVFTPGSEIELSLNPAEILVLKE